jgi:hypothetical protein
VVKARVPRGPTYGPRIIEALITCWAVLRAPVGKRLAPMLPVLVPRHNLHSLEQSTCGFYAEEGLIRIVGTRASLAEEVARELHTGTQARPDQAKVEGSHWVEVRQGVPEIHLVRHR